MEPLSPRYDPRETEPDIYRRWEAAGVFHSQVDPRRTPYVIVIPPPNVTGALHMGHALDNTIQDVLVRWHRMMGENAMWLPGTDHAGIATQAVVERRLKEEEDLTRHDLGREGLVRRIWQWKDAYEARILSQLRLMGCSCDWPRTRFTLDDVCARAVRHTFFRMFKDGLIYRGQRLVNWDTHLQTAVADDEIFHETVRGHLWYVRYPVKGSAEHLVVATTRPETMLGDTAVAVHPKDERFKHLIGKTVILPLLEREIPVIGDGILVDPAFGTGCVKVTPAHDPNDYEAGLRNHLPMINILRPDGRINEHGGPYADLSREEARKRIVADLEARRLLEKVEPYQTDVGHSDRSKTPIEPYLSDQWFVAMGGLAQTAIDAVQDGRVRFVPERYAKTYLDWLGEKRDWCISRQLYWGHRIPIWHCATATESDLTTAFGQRPDITWRRDEGRGGFLICALDALDEHALGPGHTLVQDPDVLDTWFSSALWPHSTLGWPEQTPDLAYYYPTSVLVTSRDIITLWVARMVMTGLYNVGKVPFHEVYIHAKILDGRGRTMSKSAGNGVDPVDIIEVYGADAMRFALAMMTTETQDVRLPVDYQCPHCEKTTPQSEQNMAAPRIRCPHCKGEFTAPVAADLAAAKGLPKPRMLSTKFEIGRNFCNKLWNAVRYVLLGLAESGSATAAAPAFEDRWILSRLQSTIDRTSEALAAYRFDQAAGTLYDFTWHELCDWYLEIARDRLAPTADPGARRRVQDTLIAVIETTLRLLHPLIPFITERLWGHLKEALAATDATRAGELIAVAPWPTAHPAQRDPAAEARMELVQRSIRAIRNIRADREIDRNALLDAVIRAPEGLASILAENEVLIRRMAVLKSLTVGPACERPAHAATDVIGEAEIFVPLEGVLDLDAEQRRLGDRIAKAEQSLAQSEARLRDPKFVERAPAEVVERERQRRSELSEELGKIRRNLKDLE
jgi:valyl-tRNA synthetase